MISQKNFKLTVVLPCYNEVNTIETVIEKIKSNIINLNCNDFEIIIVDDGSNDGTKEKLQKLLNKEKFKIFFHDKNSGKGSALKTAFQNIDGDIVIIQDADLEYDPSDYKKLILPFFEANADVVYGSRFIGGGKYVRIHFFWHFLANKILTFVCNIFTNLNLTDMETGYKVFKSDVIKEINIQEKSFSVEPELTIKLAKKKCKFYEVPITYNGRSYEEGKKIRFIDAFWAIKSILKHSLLYKNKK